MPSPQLASLRGSPASASPFAHLPTGPLIGQPADSAAFLYRRRRHRRRFTAAGPPSRRAVNLNPLSLTDKPVHPQQADRGGRRAAPLAALEFSLAQEHSDHGPSSRLTSPQVEQPLVSRRQNIKLNKQRGLSRRWRRRRQLWFGRSLSFFSFKHLVESPMTAHNTDFGRHLSMKPINQPSWHMCFDSLVQHNKLYSKHPNKCT